MNQFVSFLSIICVSFLMFSCENITEQQTNTDSAMQDGNALYGNTRFALPDLSEKARSYTSQWGAFEDFEGESKTINGATIEVLKNSSERLMALTDSISKNLPDTLAVQAIQSRVMVAQTRAHLLNQLVHRAQIDSAKLQMYIGEMNRATRNLIIQLNDKFEKDAIDQQRIETERKEIKDQQRKRDSIFKEELKDKNT